MKLKDILKDKEILSEAIGIPTTFEKKYHKAKYPDDGLLFYVVRDENDNKVLTYIDEKYVRELSHTKGRKVSPKEAAHIRLGQIEYFKKNK